MPAWLSAAMLEGLDAIDTAITPFAGGSSHPPIEVLIYDPERPQLVRHMIFGPEDDYLRELGRAWQGYVEKAFTVLPPLPPRPAELLRVVDE